MPHYIAARHLDVKLFPTVLALPKSGGVFRYEGSDRSVGTLKRFAEEACKR